MLYSRGNVWIWRGIAALLTLLSTVLISPARAQSPTSVPSDAVKADHPAQAIVVLTTSKAELRFRAHVRISAGKALAARKCR
jgi:hypothetical protein